MTDLFLTYNNSILTGHLYTNRALVATQAYPDTTYCPGNIGGAGGSTEIMLGNHVYGDWRFSGTVYEFRIWNGAMSPSQVAADCAVGPGTI